MMGTELLMICIDQFSKIVLLVPLCMRQMHEQLLVCFLAEVLSHHGHPVSIISYRDPRFQGSFWKELMKNLNISLSFSTTSYP